MKLIKTETQANLGRIDEIPVIENDDPPADSAKLKECAKEDVSWYDIEHEISMMDC